MKYSKDIKDGDYVTCCIEGETITDARVRYVDGQLMFICQDMKDGAKLPKHKRYGYKYSWIIRLPYKTSKAQVTELKKSLCQKNKIQEDYEIF